MWRERYPGGLSELEGAFGRAMVGLAERRRRRRRLVVATVVAALTIGLAVTGGLWRRSVAETRRAEASKVLALAQARLAEDPTEALALATASLELADTREAREQVMRALQTAPPALELDMGEEQLPVPSFSPDGRHVAVAGLASEARVWSDDGQGPTRLGGHPVSATSWTFPFWAAEDLLVTGWESGEDWSGFEELLRVWSIPGGELLRTVDLGEPKAKQVGFRRLLARTLDGRWAKEGVLLNGWRLPDGEAELLDRLSAAELAGLSGLVAAPDGSGWVVARGTTVAFRPFGGRGAERVLDVFEGGASLAPFWGSGVLASDGAGAARLWSFGHGGPSRVWAIRRPDGATGALPDPSGRRLLILGPTEQSLRVWELEGLPGARPLELRRSGPWYLPREAFHPSGDWCVATTHAHQSLTFWPLARPRPSVVEGYRFPEERRAVAFSPDSRWLATGWEDGCVRLVPVRGGDPTAARVLGPTGEDGWCADVRVSNDPCADLRFDPEGRYLFVVSMWDARVVPLDGGPCLPVVPPVAGRQIEQGAISPSGARVAAAYFFGNGPRLLYLVEVATGALQTFELPQPENPPGVPSGVNSLEFLDEQTLLTMGWGGLRRWDLATGTHELVAATDGHMRARVSRAAGAAVTWAWGSDLTPGLELVDLATGTSRSLRQFGDDVESVDLDPSGNVVATGSAGGSIRVGRLDGGEPHLLLGHTGTVSMVAISPDLRWVASSGEDDTLRLWPMPDLSKPPLHTLPHDELLATLRSLTNLRAVRDPASPGGWKVEVGPFPGWREVPTW